MLLKMLLVVPGLVSGAVAQTAACPNLAVVQIHAGPFGSVNLKVSEPASAGLSVFLVMCGASSKPSTGSSVSLASLALVGNAPPAADAFAYADTSGRILARKSPAQGFRIAAVDPAKPGAEKAGTIADGASIVLQDTQKRYWSASAAGITLKDLKGAAPTAAEIFTVQFKSAAAVAAYRSQRVTSPLGAAPPALAVTKGLVEEVADPPSKKRKK